MSFLNATQKMDAFYQETILPMYIPAVGPLVVSTLTNLIALVDLAVSKIFSCTQNLSQKHNAKLDRHLRMLQEVLKTHAINTISLGIIPWVGVIKQECSKGGRQ